jgi:glycerol kinase
VPTALIAIDQGTTSTRAIAFDASLKPLASAQQELRQIYPQPGWVEHDPEEIWQATVATVREAMVKAGLAARDIAGIGIANQRETSVIWDRATGKPIHHAIVWQDRRTAVMCDALRASGHEPEIAAKTGLLLDPYFSASKIAWLLDHVDGARAQAQAGRLAFGTIDCFLLWRLTGGKVHATDASNAARTLLLDIGSAEWDDNLCRMFGVPRSLLPRVADCAGEFGPHLTCSAPHPDPRHGRRPAGGHRRAGLLFARHDEIDLRHRLLCPAQHRQRAGCLAQPAAHHHRLSARRKT